MCLVEYESCYVSVFLPIFMEGVLLGVEEGGEINQREREKGVRNHS